MDLHVVHVVRDLDVSSGGPSRSVPALANAQARLDGVKVSVLYQDRGNRVAPLGETLVTFTACRLQDFISGNAFVSMLLDGKSHHIVTILHIHGLWSPTLHRWAWHARNRNLNYVISTRGMLADWALRNKAVRKRLAWHLYQRRDLVSASAIVASSEFEHRDVALHLPGSRIAVIPNGCDAPLEDGLTKAFLPSQEGISWAVAVGRLHPVKGYAELIEAWARANPDGWMLAIVGPDENGYRAKLEALILERGLQNRVILTGEVNDHKKWSVLDQCELFLAPSRTENFGMAIAEALLSGKPVITTTGTPWREIPEVGCGWWIDLDAESLERALSEATSTTPETLKEMGQRGRELIRQRYSWPQVARKSIDLYREIIQSHQFSV